MAHNFLPADVSVSEVFYGGAAGGGKSDWLLMGALEYVDVPGYAALILRRTFQDLALPGAIMERSQAWLRGTDARWNDQRKTWTFPSGAKLTFGYLRQEDDVYQYQGAEFQFVGFDELTQFTERQYTYLFSRVRRPQVPCAVCGPHEQNEDSRWPCPIHPDAAPEPVYAKENPDRVRLAQVPLRMRAASNPGGVGHGWVKKRFPITEPKPPRVFISARLDDNPHLDRRSYEESLSELPEITREQLLRGDWDAFEGAAYPFFTDPVHVVPTMTAPASWDRFEFMDFGSANPTAWYVACIDYDGNVIVLDEYFSPGSIAEHAPEVIELRRRAWAHTPDGKPVQAVCFPDPSIRNEIGLTRWGRKISIEQEFLDWNPRCDGYEFRFGNSDNSRRSGFVRVQTLLRPDPERPFPEWHPLAGQRGAPRMFLTRRCAHLVETVRNAPLAPLDSGHKDAGEVVDIRWESSQGHAHAALRYGAMSRPAPGVEPVPEEGDLRRAAVARLWRDDDDQEDERADRELEYV